MNDNPPDPEAPDAELGPDEEAMWRVKTEGDPRAFALLVARWEQKIQRLCARLTGDAHQAEDLSQETFARLYAYRRRYDVSAKFSTFLWRIALNLCHDDYRRRIRRPECPLDGWERSIEGDPASGGPRVLPPDHELAQREEAEQVRRAVLELAEPYRVVVVLRHYEELRFREIAELLGVPEGTVKSRMAEALNQLGRVLGRLPETQPTCLEVKSIRL